MGESSADERARLICEATLRADAVRRSLAYSLFGIFGITFWTLGTLVPGAQKLYGELTVTTMFAFVAPAQLAVVTCFVLYRTTGPASRAYRWAETAENLIDMTLCMGAVFGTRATWPVMWIFSPFCMVCFAATKPFDRRRHAAVLFLSHAGLAIAYVVRGDAALALVVVVMGALAWLTFSLVARKTIQKLVLKAARNVAQGRLHEAMLDGARRRAL